MDCRYRAFGANVLAHAFMPPLVRAIVVDQTLWKLARWLPGVVSCDFAVVQRNRMQCCNESSIRGPITNVSPVAINTSMSVLPKLSYLYLNGCNVADTWLMCSTMTVVRSAVKLNGSLTNFYSDRHVIFQKCYLSAAPGWLCVS